MEKAIIPEGAELSEIFHVSGAPALLLRGPTETGNLNRGCVFSGYLGASWPGPVQEATGLRPNPWDSHLEILDTWSFPQLPGVSPHSSTSQSLRI